MRSSSRRSIFTSLFHFSDVAAVEEEEPLLGDVDDLFADDDRDVVVVEDDEGNFEL